MSNFCLLSGERDCRAAASFANISVFGVKTDKGTGNTESKV